MTQEVTPQQIIPVKVDPLKEENRRSQTVKAIYEYEPDEETILDKFFLKMLLFKFIMLFWKMPQANKEPV